MARWSRPAISMTLPRGTLWRPKFKVRQRPMFSVARARGRAIATLGLPGLSPRVQRFSSEPLENPCFEGEWHAERPPASYAGGRRGKERAASLRAEQRLAAGGRSLPRPKAQR